MGFLTSALSFVVVLGIIIFVHEFGHLITAKAFGMRVFVFSFGFGKRLFGFQWGDTDCRVSLVPLGGYVKLEGEPDDLVSEDTSVRGDGNDFVSRPRWQRFLVYMAGPVMNAVLTFAVLVGLYRVGYEESGTMLQRPVIGAVEKGSPAEAAGLEAGDEILSIDGTPQPTWNNALYSIVIRPNAQVQMRVRRSGQERDVVVHSAALPPENAGTIGVRPLTFVQDVTSGSAAEAAGIKAGDGIVRVGERSISAVTDVIDAITANGPKAVVVRLYRDDRFVDLSVTPRDTGAGPKIGVSLGEKLVVQRYGFAGATKAAARRTVEMAQQIFEVMGRLLTARISPKTMAGPLGIAQMSGEAARRGAQYWWSFVAFISINVGILNLFPLVPLDGGHLAILAVEGVARRDMSPPVKGWIMNAGAAVIFLLIGLVLFSDISKQAFVQRLLR